MFFVSAGCVADARSIGGAEDTIGGYSKEESSRERQSSSFDHKKACATLGKCISANDAKGPSTSAESCLDSPKELMVLPQIGPLSVRICDASSWYWKTYQKTSGSCLLRMPEVLG